MGQLFAAFVCWGVCGGFWMVTARLLKARGWL
jgi:hypothetical protein